MPIDYSKYPTSWKTAIVPAILARSKHKCEICGVNNHALILRDKKDKSVWRYICPEEYDMIVSKCRYSSHTFYSAVKNLGFTRIVLTVAHLDHDTNNNDYSNLSALCQYHHFKHDAKQHQNSRKYGKHYLENQSKLDL